MNHYSPSVCAHGHGPRPQFRCPSRTGSAISAWLLGVCFLLSGCLPFDDLSLRGSAQNSAAMGPTSAVDVLVSGDTSTLSANSVHLEGHRTAADLSGSLGAAGDYDLYEFGAGAAGDRWSVTNRNLLTGGRFVVALFDENMELLARSGSGTDPSLSIVLRHDCALVCVGVATRTGANGGIYYLHVARTAGNPVPGPQPQAVWLDFTGASNLSINKYDSLSFGPFSGSMVGKRFADATDDLKQLIVDTLLCNYADYDVTVYTSDAPPPPGEAHATIYFGGRGDAQLGIADNVDTYNGYPEQSAVVFVEALTEYEDMRLTVTQVGTMIGNIASHELGHLLGLQHVQDGHHVMNRADSSTIWDMTAPQHFDPADLDPRVFPVGRLNARRLLEETVGLKSGQ
jgi:hypothetical protein